MIMRSHYLSVKSKGLVKSLEQPMANTKAAVRPSLATLVLQLLGESQLSLVALDRLLQAAHLHQDVPLVGQRPELCLVVLHQVGDGEEVLLAFEGALQVPDDRVRQS